MKNKTKIFIFLFVIFFNLTISLAQEAEVAEIYKEKNNFFTFSPPAGWTKEGFVNDTSSQVTFRSPDGKAELAVIAQLNEGEPNELFFQKSEYIRDYQKRFPEGKFVLTWDTLGKRRVIKIDFEFPGLIKQEQYFFFDQGIRFDLIYGVINSEDFEIYKQLALDAFATVQRQNPLQKKQKPND